MEQCRDKFKRVVDQYVGRYDRDSTQNLGIFLSGFLTGLAEKVWIGACDAAMIAPESEHSGMAAHILYGISRIYDLRIEWLRVGSTIEYWMLRPEAASMWERMKNLVENQASDAEINTIRAALTGVRHVDLDYKWRHK